MEPQRPLWQLRVCAQPCTGGALDLFTSADNLHINHVPDRGRRSRRDWAQAGAGRSSVWPTDCRKHLLARHLL